MMSIIAFQTFLLEHDLFGKPASTFPDHARGDSKSNGVARACARVIA
jgi:hypothetical protein